MSRLKNTSVVWHISLIILLVALCYIPIIQSDFIDLEDTQLILENPVIKNLNRSHLQFLFKNAQIAQSSPLSLITFALDYKLWKTNPLGYHVTNGVIYVFLCVFLYLFLEKLLRFRNYAFIFALLFALHPSHISVVTWISSRGLILSGLFLVLCLYFFQKHMMDKDTYSYTSLTVLLSIYILGLLSSWRIMYLPLLLLLLDITSFRNISLKAFAQKRLKTHVVLGLTTLGYLFYITSGLTQGTFSIFEPLWTKVILIFRFFFYPHPLSIIYPLSNLQNTSTYIWGFAIFCLLLILITTSIFKSRYRHFILTFVVLSLLFSILFTDDTYFTLRQSFYPSIALVIFFAVSFEILTHISKSKSLERWILLGASLCAVIFLPLTYNHNLTWKNSFKVWHNVKAIFPDNTISYNQLGKLYIAKGDLGAAEKELLVAIEKNPDDLFSYVNLGILHQKRGQIDKAIVTYQKASENNPDSDIPHYHLFQIHVSLGDTEKAREELKEAIRIKPNIHIYHAFLANIYRKENLITDAIKEYRLAIKLYPVHMEYYEQLAKLYMMNSQYDKALRNFSIVLRSQPRNIEIKYQVGLILFEMKNFRQAKPMFRDVINRDPLNYLPCYYLAKTLAELKDYKKAHDYFTQTIKLRPNLTIAMVDEGLLYFEEGQFDQAQTMLIRALRVNPNMYKARRALDKVRKAKHALSQSAEKEQ